MNFLLQAVRGKVLAALALIFLAASLSLLLLSPGETYYSGSVFDRSFAGHSELLSSLSSVRDVRVLSFPVKLEGGEILVIPAPAEEVPPEFVESLLSLGGSVIISDASENTDALLNSLGITRGSGPIVDKESYHVREDAPLYAFMGGNFASKLSYPISCSPGENCSALLRSSRMSWMDEDQSGYLDENDRAGPFAAAIAMAKDANRTNVIVVGDRSAFSNDLLGKSPYSNKEFLLRSVALLDPEKKARVVVYEGGKSNHGPIVSSAINASLLLRSPFTLMLLAAVVLAAVFAYPKKKADAVAPTRFTSLVQGVNSNLGKRREAYVWTAIRLRSLLASELERLSKSQARPDSKVKPGVFSRAKEHLAILNSSDFDKMDAVSLERTIDETARVISSTRQDDYPG